MKLSKHNSSSNRNSYIVQLLCCNAEAQNITLGLELRLFIRLFVKQTVRYRAVVVLFKLWLLNSVLKIIIIPK